MSVNIVNSDGSTTLIAGGTFYADSPIGSILPYGGATAPSGWFICDGTAVSRTTYAELFAVIGTSFGAGDGSTTFNLPDMRESVPKGAGLTGKTVGAHLDADGLAVGEFLDDRMQNITGSLSAASDEASFDMNMTGGGAISAYNEQRLSAASLERFNSWTGFDFDASRVARTGATTEVKSVGVNYIIRAKMVALPIDLDEGVDEKISEIVTDTVTSGSTAPVSSGGVYTYVNTMITQALAGSY